MLKLQNNDVIVYNMQNIAKEILKDQSLMLELAIFSFRNIEIRNKDLQKVEITCNTYFKGSKN